MIKNPFAQKKYWVLDGGLASELVYKGFDLNHPLWSAKVLTENSKAIYDVHMSFLQAGAEILLTSSYQGTVEGFVKHFNMYEREAQEVLFFTVELACRAREDFLREKKSNQPILIGASIGPFGAILANGSEFRGDYELTEKVSEYYRKKIENLILPRKNIKADFLAFETIPTAAEAEIIIAELKSIPWAPSWICFSKPEEALLAVKKLDSCEQIVAWGLNCLEPQRVAEYLPKLRGLTRKPLVVYPNRGQIYDVQKKTWDEDTGDKSSFGEYAKIWASLGAQIIGGCCQTTPEDIAEVAAFISKI